MRHIIIDIHHYGGIRTYEHKGNITYKYGDIKIWNHGHNEIRGIEYKYDMETLVNGIIGGIPIET